MATRRRALGKVDNIIDQKILHPVGKKRRPYFYFSRKIASFLLLLTAFLSFRYVFISTSTLTRETTMMESSSINTSSPISQRPLKCTMEQLMKVRSQLSPELCVDNHVHHLNFIQKCTITTATKCPKASWIDQYYRERYNQYYESSPGSLANNEKSSFLGISIGCNKGFDAINTLRMGTFDESINKSLWKRAMTDNGKIPLAGSVCKQDRAEDIFQIPKSPDSSAAVSTNNQKDRPRGEMHCVEPLPATYKMLSKSAENLGYTQKGFKVTHAAVSKESGEMLFSSKDKVGLENQGLATCKRKKKSKSNSTDCVTVPVYSLKEFVQKNVKADKSDPINVLSIDVEGFDGDVLLGATEEVLKRVEYLEFEYNWMGSWENQHLFDIIEMLDASADMTCYWSGIDRLWRITECWMSYFDIHTWSNVACVNRVRAPKLASIMEDVFLRTIEEDYGGKPRWIKEDIPIKAVKYYRRIMKDHVLMSLDEKELRSKYIPSPK